MESPKRKKSPRGAREGRADPPKPQRLMEDGSFGLLNRDPKMKYVWANTDDMQTGMAHYQMMGWRVVETSSGGVRACVNPEQVVGQEVRIKELILMQLPVERWLQIQQHGAGGGRGMERAREAYGQLFRNSGAEDRARGQGHRLGNGIAGFEENY